MLELLASKYQDKVKLAKLNVDKNPKTLDRFPIRGLPTFPFIKKGKLLEQVSDVKTESELAEIIERHTVPSKEVRNRQPRFQKSGYFVRRILRFEENESQVRLYLFLTIATIIKPSIMPVTRTEDVVKTAADLRNQLASLQNAAPQLMQ